MAKLDLSATMDAIAAALTAGGYEHRVHAWPTDAIHPPCAIVGYPTALTLGITFHRGGDEATIPVWLIVGLATAEATRDDLSDLIGSATDVKTALDGTLSGLVSGCDCRGGDIERVVIGGQPYVSLRFDLDVVSQEPPMSFKMGKNTAVWLGGTDLSPVLNSAGMTVGVDTADTSTFGSTWKSFLPGLQGATLSFAGLYDPDYSVVLEGIVGAGSTVLTYCPGGAAAIGDLARLVPAIETSYAQSSPVADAVAISLDVLADDDMAFGWVLHPLGEDTNTTTGATRDDAAATSTGWTAHLHVTAVDATIGSWVVKLEDSANGSAWSDVSGGAFTTTNVTTSERLTGATATATLRRYVRYSATRTSGIAGEGITFALSYART